jgi:hypothetical protein
MNEDGPDGSPYGTLAKHDQSETKRDSGDVERLAAHKHRAIGIPQSLVHSMGLETHVGTWVWAWWVWAWV